MQYLRGVCLSFLYPIHYELPKVGSVGPVLSQSTSSKACERRTLKAVSLTHLHRCRAILVIDVVARFRGSVPSGYPVLLMFRHPLNPNPLEKGSHSPREAMMPWREADLLLCPQLMHLAGSFLASLFFHLSPRNDNAFHFCFTDICYQEHWLHSLIHGDERCWINSKLYLLFSLLLLVKLPSTLLTSCQKLCLMSSPWKSKYRLQRLDYYFFFLSWQ